MILERSIIIPAHNEAAVIGQTLAALLDGVGPSDATVVVVANGCTDETAVVARAAAPWITVLSTAEAGKTAAIRAAETHLGPGPRIYLDADVRLPGASAMAIFSRLSSGDIDGARPPALTDLSGATWLVRSYHRARTRLTNVQNEFSGGGCYGLSWNVRQTFGTFPDVLGDDLFAARIVSPDRAEIIEAPPVVIRPPRNAVSLRNVLARNVRGNRQMSQMFPGISPLTTKQTMLSLVRSVKGPLSGVDAVIYAGFVTAGRVHAQRSQTRWERDDSSRHVEVTA